MRLSTSSFDRPVPDLPWLRLAGIALVIAALAVAVWEVQVRNMGYGPCLNDTDDLWAVHRDQVSEDSLVIIGSSRTLFDLDLEVVEQALGQRPIHLGVVGSCPRPMLSDLADDEGFGGTLVVGVTPGLFFAAGGPPVQKTEDWLTYRTKRAPSKRVGQMLSRVLERRLALLNQEDLSLEKLIGRVQLPNRSQARLPPRLPPYLGLIREDRTVAMSPRLAHDPEFQREIQEIWRGLVASQPPMDEQTVTAVREGVFAQVRGAVARLRSRGVKVVFLRLPSTEFLHEVELKFAPREVYWDGLLEAADAPGVHFEDHPELSGFDCPEWSHLTSEDATRFTRALMPILASRIDRADQVKGDGA